MQSTGIVNIITKHTANTQGSLISLSTDTEDKGTIQARDGSKIGQDTYARISVKAASHDDFDHTLSDSAHDAWKNYLANFRLDSQITNNDQLFVSAGITKSNADRLNLFPSLATLNNVSRFDQSEESGGPLLASWQHTLSPTPEVLLQGYYDHFEIESDAWNDQWDIFDIDFQHQFFASSQHEIIWGLGYRFSHASSPGSFNTTYTNPERNDSLYSAFIQDEIQLIDNELWLTLGSKFEHNDYTGFEFQPSLRLLWSPDEKQKVWTALSRAVRTPSRFEHEVIALANIIQPSSPLNPGPLPVATTFFGNEDFKSEDVIAWEIGYRLIPTENISLHIATYYNEYHHLSENHTDAAIFHGSYIEQPVIIDNNYSADSYGIEVSAHWKINNHLSNQFSRELERPEIHQFSLCSEVNINHHLNLNLWLRHVDDTVTHSAIEGFRVDIDDYITMDATVIWRPNKQLELSITGKNLLESDHIEYADAGFSLPFMTIPRSVFAQLRINF